MCFLICSKLSMSKIQNKIVNFKLTVDVPMAKMRSSGRQPMPHTLASSYGAGCVHRTCKFNRWTMTSPKNPKGRDINYKKYTKIPHFPLNTFFALNQCLPLSLLMAIKSILWLHVNNSILYPTPLELCSRIKLDIVELNSLHSNN